MDELMEYVIPNGKDFQLVDPIEYDYWLNRKQRCFYIDFEVEDDYRCIELMKTIIQMNIAEKDIPEDSLQPIKIFLFSYGGDLSQATALCDVIEASRIPIVTICMGVAMSAGFLIFLAGKRRYALKQSTLLVHQGSAAFSGSASEIGQSVRNNQLLRETSTLLISISLFSETSSIQVLSSLNHLYCEPMRKMKVFSSSVAAIGSTKPPFLPPAPPKETIIGKVFSGCGLRTLMMI